MSRVFIYGGCTSRDAVDLYKDFGLELHSYIARQSLISAFRPADPLLFEVAADERPFQRRMLAGDVRGSMPKHVRANAQEIDLVIWDLMIERVGVNKVRSGGMVTRNGTHLAPDAPEDALQGAYVFGTDAHFGQWKWALDRFLSLLEDTDLTERVVVNATPWAVVDKNGERAQSKSTMTPEWFNGHILRYWDAIEERGLRVARVPQSAAVADPDHKWGPAYFHYVEDTYRAQLDLILAHGGVAGADTR
ncbi:MAG: DUF6270 domain-containing protein [Propionibacteriaceae bacterium]|nr:DUF6270 domain-containing protein [Propionibacteriaceae bacterium]